MLCFLIIVNCDLGLAFEACRGCRWEEKEAAAAQNGGSPGVPPPPPAPSQEPGKEVGKKGTSSAL